jgi:hypothetical protein
VRRCTLRQVCSVRNRKAKSDRIDIDVLSSYFRSTMEQHTDGMHRWKTVRQNGILHFVLFRGILFYGGLMFIASLLWLAYNGSLLNWSLVISAGLLWLIIGGAYGLIRWTLSERTFKRVSTQTNGGTESET